MILPLLLLTATSTVHRYALIVGHNASLDAARKELRFADDDAARFYEMLAPLTERAHFLAELDRDSQEMFPELVESAKPATRANFEWAASDLLRLIEQDANRGLRTELYFFYAGHGDVEDGEGYVSLRDGKLTRSDLRRLVLEPARASAIHVVVDACKSYFLVTGRGPGGEREAYTQSFARRDAPATVGYVVSTSNDAESHEWSALLAGVFSHEVRSGLLGGADVGADGVVDYDELAAFVGAANAAIPSPRYRPRFFIRAPEGNKSAPLFPTAAIPGARKLELGVLERGRISITDERGLRHLDAHKAPGSALSLVLLASRRYEVRWQNEVRTIVAAEGDVRLTEVPIDLESVAHRGEAHRAFEHLFAQPFSPELLAGFRIAQVESITLETPVVEREAAWLPPLLIGTGIAAVAAGSTLAYLAVRDYAGASESSQVDRDRLSRRGNRLAGGAAGAFAVGVGALGVGLTLEWMGLP